jgi:hypothetical protein
MKLQEQIHCQGISLEHIAYLPFPVLHYGHQWIFNLGRQHPCRPLKDLTLQRSRDFWQEIGSNHESQRRTFRSNVSLKNEIKINVKKKVLEKISFQSSVPLIYRHQSRLDENTCQIGIYISIPSQSSAGGRLR